MGGNTFYSNAEAYAFEILHQTLLKEAQRSAQQTVMELAALKSFLCQGQLLYCIPIGGLAHYPSTLPLPLPFPLFPSDPSLPPSDHHHHHHQHHQHFLPSSPANSSCSPSATAPAPAPAPPHPPPPPPSQPHPQSILHVNLKHGQAKLFGTPGSDECNLGKDGIEVTIDLREYLPAEINLDVDEKTVEIKACHVDPQGSKTFARRYDLPACILPDSVRCVLTHDGILMFSAAWLKME